MTKNKNHKPEETTIKAVENKSGSPGENKILKVYQFEDLEEWVYLKDIKECFDRIKNIFHSSCDLPNTTKEQVKVFDFVLDIIDEEIGEDLK